MSRVRAAPAAAWLAGLACGAAAAAVTSCGPRCPPVEWLTPVPSRWEVTAASVPEAVGGTVEIQPTSPGSDDRYLTLRFADGPTNVVEVEYLWP